MALELLLSAADQTRMLRDGECSVASDCLVHGLSRSSEILAVVVGARADVGEYGFSLGHGEAIFEPLDANVGEERLKLSRPDFESEGLDVAPEVPAGDESIKLGKVASPVSSRRGRCLPKPRRV
jgi:hypothetical protein